MTHYFDNGKVTTKAVFDSWGGASAGVDWAVVLGSTLKTPEGDKPTGSVLANKRHVALVFSGSWCPWCRAFEPMLEDMYKKVKANDPNDTEIVYVSVDADSVAFDEATRGNRGRQCRMISRKAIAPLPSGLSRGRLARNRTRPLVHSKNTASAACHPSSLPTARLAALCAKMAGKSLAASQKMIVESWF
ncbi:unnamed protein product [Prorocentrum cordatum]|uniref:Thioredoxin-like fold domain-containing protein n=1 Tax=Prorocentrum cordatum TaxID=2364126 RepID=A0ABN9WS65_9DINO|nr:unnamed protein product [Polarella glacialis]